jgi:hypothetical protein
MHMLERAFKDVGVVAVDYRRAYGRHVKFERGLAGFVCDFDAGHYPKLLTSR